MRQVVGQLPTDPNDAAEKLEAVLLKQLIASSGAFKSSEMAGGQLRSDMFVEALADAVAKGGGIGIAKLLERTMDGQSSPGEAPAPVHQHPPAASSLTTSGFGMRSDPIEGDARFHSGVDLAVPLGTPVLAAKEGIVSFAGDRGGYGQMVQIDHGNGLSTRYAHNGELLVSEGDSVGPGQMLARSGASGRATGPHLHFEVRQNGRPVDPHRALNAYGIRVEGTVAVKTHPPKGGVP